MDSHCIAWLYLAPVLEQILHRMQNDSAEEIFAEG